MIDRNLDHNDNPLQIYLWSISEKGAAVVADVATKTATEATVMMEGEWEYPLIEILLLMLLIWVLYQK